MKNCILKTVVFCLSAFLLFGCAKQRKTESVVKDFLNENLTESKYSVSFSKIDSTAYINAKSINAMKVAVSKNKAYKKGIKYGSDKSSGKYVYTKAKIFVGKDTLIQTFYLDNALTHVVAFKEN